MLWTHGVGQGILDNHKDFPDAVVKNIYKRITLGQVLTNHVFLSKTEKIGLLGPIGEIGLLDFPGFGYEPFTLDYSFKPLEIKYPDTTWSLFEISFLKSEKNDSLIAWTHRGLYVPSSRKNMLIGVNARDEIKLISTGTILKHRIADDFKISAERPDSYIDFLKYRLYIFQFDKIEFLKKGDAETLVYLAVKNEVEGRQKKWELHVNAENPERHSVIYVGDKVVGNYDIPPQISFKDFEDKKSYLFNALMKNIYAYRIHNIDGVENKVGIDTSNWLLSGHSSMIDSVLPYSDEYLNGLKIVKINLKGNQQYCGSAWPDYQKLILSKNSSQIIGNTLNQNIEIYRIVRDTFDVLCNRDIQNKVCRPDIFYNKELKKKHLAWKNKEKGPLPPPSPNLPEDIFSLCASCMPYGFNFPEEWKKRLEYYLLALDSETKEVFFISGKDIYLSNVAHLYSPKEIKFNGNILNWPIKYKLNYIKDRLYCYQVSEVAEKNILMTDNEGVTLFVRGEEFGASKEIRVILRDKEPNLIEIDIH